MRVIFMGTPDFASATLQALIDAGHEIALVVTQPDKPAGRGKQVKGSPVKELAEAAGLPVYQPVKVKDPEAIEILRGVNADVIIVVAFGQILPQAVLDLTPYGCINVHASLLPAWRGAAPIQWALLNGDTVTGVTTMQMDAGMDTGDILRVEKVPISIDDTAESLFETLSVLGAETMLATIDDIEQGRAHPVPQDHAQATTVGLLTKQLGEVDWTKPALQIHNQIRGLYSWPGAYTFLDGTMLKLHKSTLTNDKREKPAGTVVQSKDRLLVCCGDGQCIELSEVQLVGKKRMAAADFLRGHAVPVGTILTSAEKEA